MIQNRHGLLIPQTLKWCACWKFSVSLTCTQTSRCRCTWCTYPRQRVAPVQQEWLWRVVAAPCGVVWRITGPQHLETNRWGTGAVWPLPCGETGRSWLTLWTLAKRVSKSKAMLGKLLRDVVEHRIMMGFYRCIDAILNWTDWNWAETGYIACCAVVFVKHCFDSSEQIYETKQKPTEQAYPFLTFRVLSS